MRVKAGLDQRDVAERLGVSHVTAWNYENFETFPISLVALRKWVEAVGPKLKITIVARNGEEFTF